jgi:recombinational DNA repair ATPase RecF
MDGPFEQEIILHMNSPLLWTAVVLGSLAALGAQAQSSPVPAEKRELIYCADRMTHEEREAYRAKMRAARSHEEKETLRTAHRAEMRARANDQRAADCQPPGQQWRGGGQQ